MTNEGGSMGDGVIWVVRAGSGGTYATDFEEAGLTAIGFSEAGDVTGLSRDEIRHRFEQQLGDSESSGAISNAAGQVFRYANEINEGDWILMPDGETREIAFGTVTGPYEHGDRSPIAGYSHVRTVDWKGRRTRDDLPQRILYSLGSVLTVFQPKGEPYLRAFIAGDPVPSGPDHEAHPSNGDEVVDTSTDADDIFKDLQSRADELIQQRIAFLGGYQTQDLVAGLLRAMGYHTQVVPEGPDGGADIIASRDPLAVEPPIIKVQVKARPNSRSGASEIRELIGVLREGERGIFVATGGFSRDARRDAMGRVQLIDIDRLQELVVEHYEELDQDTKSLVPLRRLYFP